MPPAIIAAGVVAAGAIGGAVISSGSQKSAANTAAQAQTQATDSQLQLGQQNIAFQQGIYDQNKALLSPFVQRGDQAGNQINALLGLGGNSTPQATPQTPSAPQPGFQTASPYTQQPVNGAMPYGYSATGPFFGGGGGARFRLLDETGSDTGYQPNSYGMGALRTQDTANSGTMNYAGQPAQQTTAPAPAATGQTGAGSAQDAFNQFAHSAGIDFQLQQGTNALQNSAAARGLLQSGSTLKALQNYGQNTALNNYFLPYMGLLQGQQATGAQSGAAIAGVGSNFGNTVSSIYGNQGNAIQNGADATSNAALLRGQANAGLGNSIGSALGTFGSSFFQPSGFNSASYLNTPATFSSGFGGTPYTATANFGPFPTIGGY